MISQPIYGWLPAQKNNVQPCEEHWPLFAGLISDTNICIVLILELLFWLCVLYWYRYCSSVLICGCWNIPSFTFWGNSFLYAESWDLALYYIWVDNGGGMGVPVFFSFTYFSLRRVCPMAMKYCTNIEGKYILSWATWHTQIQGVRDSIGVIGNFLILHFLTFPKYTQRLFKANKN